MKMSENIKNHSGGNNSREAVPRLAFKPIAKGAFVSPLRKKTHGGLDARPPPLFFLPDHVWGVVLDNLTTCSATFAKPCTSSVSTAIALSTLLDRTVARPAPQPRLDTPWGGKRRPPSPSEQEPEQTPAVLLVCKGWTALFEGRTGRARRPRAWLTQVFGVRPSAGGTEAAAHLSLRQRLQVVRSYNAANAARSLQVSPDAALAGLDPFQTDLWQQHRDTWWQAMRVTVARMAKRPWAVRDLKLTLGGVDRAAAAASGAGGLMTAFAAAFSDLDQAAAALFPEAKAQGRLLAAAPAAAAFGAKLRRFSETSSSSAAVDPQRLFAEVLNDDAAKRPPNPSLLAPSDEAESAGHREAAHIEAGGDGGASDAGGGAGDGVEVMFESFEVDADNYEEVRYGGNYGPCDRPSVQASDRSAASGTNGGGNLRPYSLHLCIDPSPRPGKFPLRLECRLVLLPAGWAHWVRTAEDLEAVPHLVLEGSVKPFAFDLPLHLTSHGGLGPKLGRGFSAGVEHGR